MRDEKLLKQTCKLIPGAQWNGNRGLVEGSEHALALVQVAMRGQPLHEQKVEKAPAAFPFKQLPAFQRDGAYFVSQRAESGVLCNDDMGLGKTIQAIAAVCSQPNNSTKVVVCPGYLRSQWAGEITKWVKHFTGETPQVMALLPHLLRRKRHNLTRENYKTGCWVVTSYHKVKEALDLVEYDPITTIIDECHNLRGLGTKRTDNVEALSKFSQSRIALTGSLLYNDAAKLHPVLNIIEPGGWGTYYDFTKRYASGFQDDWGWKVGKLSNGAELRARLSFMAVRRTRAEVKDQLPFEAKYQMVWCDLEGDDMKSALVGVVKGSVTEGDYMRRLAEAKAPAVVEAVRNDLDAGVSSLTFTWMREAAVHLSAQIEGSLALTGDETADQRVKTLAQYLKRCAVEKRPPVVFGTMGSIGEGLNMQWAKSVNLSALDYSPDMLRQAIARAVRMGQTGDVIVKLFAARRTADEHFLTTLLAKLREQTELSPTVEPDKKALAEAFSPRATADALKKLYERMLQEEVMEG